MAEFVPYDDNKHHNQFQELNIEYITWFRDEMLANYNIDLFTGRSTVREYIENTLPEFIEAKPPEGVIFILEVDGKMCGMGALKKLEEGISEVKRMYVRPEYRGNGYGKGMLNRLIEAAKEYGYSTLRLDTGEFMKAAVSLYRSAGFMEREPYPGTEYTRDSKTHIFMEKKL